MSQKTFEEYIDGRKFECINGEEMFVEMSSDGNFRCKTKDFTYTKMSKEILLIHIDLSSTEELKENIRNLFPEEFI